MPFEIAPGVIQKGNAYYNTNYYETPRGKAELAAEQRAEAERQLNDIRDSINHQSQRDAIDAGLSAEERAQRAEIAATSLEAVNALQPLAAAGSIDGKGIRQAIGTSVTSTLADQRNVRKAHRDMETVMKLRENGTHNEMQTAKALEAMEREYGLNILRRVPGYAQAAGIEQQLEQEKIEMRRAFAKQYGIPEHLVAFNDDTFRPEFDRNGAAIELYKSNQQDAATEREDKIWRRKIEANDVRLTVIGKQLTNIGNRIDVFVKNQIPVPADLKAEYLALQNELQIGQAWQADTASQRPVLDAAPQATAKSYSNRAEALAAARGGAINSGDRVIIGGVPARFVNGLFQKVQ